MVNNLTIVFGILIRSKKHIMKYYFFIKLWLGRVWAMLVDVSLSLFLTMLPQLFNR